MSVPREAGGGSQRIADRLAITELLYRYAELIDAGDFDGVGQLLSRGTFAGVSGADAIAKLFAMTTRRYPDHGNTPRTRHLVLNPIVEISAERTAIARSTFWSCRTPRPWPCSRSWSAAISTASAATQMFLPAGTSLHARSTSR